MATEKKVTSSDLRQVFWRSMANQSAFSFERMQALGWTFALMPMLKKLYSNADEFKAALRRHLTFVNSEPAMLNIIAGVTASMEEKRANGAEIDDAAINGIKTALMGPFAGIGDSILQSAIRSIAAGVGVSLASQGSILGPILFLLIYNVFNMGLRWYGLQYGFKFGDQLLGGVSGGQLKNYMVAASLIGLLVAGAMVGNFVTVKTPLAYVINADTQIALQSTLDAIAPGLLGLVLTLLVTWALRRGMSTGKVMIVAVVVSLILGYFKILA